MLTRGVYMFSEITVAIIWSWLFFNCQYIDYWFLIFSKLLLSFLVFSNAFVQPVSTSVVSSPSEIAKRSKFHTSSSFPYTKWVWDIMEYLFKPSYFEIGWAAPLSYRWRGLQFCRNHIPRVTLASKTLSDMQVVEVQDPFPSRHFRTPQFCPFIASHHFGIFRYARLVPHSDWFCRDLPLSHMLNEEGLKEIIRWRNEGVVCIGNKIKSYNSIKMFKNWGSGRIFWSSDVEKMDAAVARSTFGHENA